MPITPIDPLVRTDPNFKSDVDNFFLTVLPTFVTEANTLASDVEDDKDAASASASAASGSASAASGSASAASVSAAAALASQNSASAYATSALNAPGTSATSTTSATVGTGSKTLTIQTGKAYSVGQFVIVASTASPSNYMAGQITAHNSGTGSLTVNATSTGGTGTYSDWTVSLSTAGFLPVSSVPSALYSFHNFSSF